ncbi:flagellar assembly regulator FliX [soil metagenome]
MKVGGASGSAPVTSGGGVRREAAPGFAPLGANPSVTSAAPASAAGAVSGLEALLALQEPQDALSRRRRAVRRADGVLDGLDALKLAVLGEGDPASALDRLSRAVRERRGEVDDPGLQDVLEAIETRAAVELAKREAAGAAA